MKSKSKSIGVLLLLSMLSAPIFADIETGSKAPSCIKSGSAYTETMNANQRKELFVKGTITDCSDKVWDIVLIPGSDVSKEMTVSAVKRSGKRIVDHTTHLVESETYTGMGGHIKETFTDSGEIAVDGLKLIKKGAVDDIVMDGLVGNIVMETGSDWAEGWSDAGAAIADGNFGWTVAALWAGLVRPTIYTAYNFGEAVFYDLPSGALRITGGTLQTLFGATGMVVSPILSPGYEVIVRPLGALTISVIDTVVVGGLTSGAIYVWNGTSWTLSQLNDIPNRESRVAGMNLVELNFDPNAPEHQRKVTKIEMATFSHMIQSQIKNVDLVNAEAPLTEKQIEKKEEIKGLKQEIANAEGEISKLYTEKRELNNAYDNDVTVKAARKLMRDVRYADEVTVNDGVKLVIKDIKALKDLVLETSNEMEVEVSDEEAEKIATELVKTFSTIEKTDKQ